MFFVNLKKNRFCDLFRVAFDLVTVKSTGTGLICPIRVLESSKNSRSLLTLQFVINRTNYKLRFPTSLRSNRMFSFYQIRIFRSNIFLSFEKFQFAVSPSFATPVFLPFRPKIRGIPRRKPRDLSPHRRWLRRKHFSEFNSAWKAGNGGGNRPWEARA